MKQKLKEVNRGLVLAVILLIGVVIYVNWQNHVFKKNIPVIEKTVEELGDDVLQANVGDAKGFKRRATSAVQNSYTGMGDISKEVFENRSSLLSAIDNLDNTASEGRIYEIGMDIDNIDVHKVGSGAKVTVQYTVNMVITGSPQYLSLGGFLWTEGADDDQKRRLTHECVMELYMKQANGGWKVVYVDRNMQYSERMELVNDDDTEEVNGDG